MWLIFIAPLIFNPILITATVLFFGIRFINKRQLWQNRWFLGACAVAAVLVAADTYFARERVAYVAALPEAPVVEQTIPLPRQLIWAGGNCRDLCTQLLQTRAVEEIIYVDLPGRGPNGEYREPSAKRLRAAWVLPGTCPSARLSYPGPGPSEAVIEEGFCPLIEEVAIPTEGIFVVQETHFVTANFMSKSVKPYLLQNAPSGRVIRFSGVEVQERKNGKVTVLAHSRYVEAPTYLGPLLGCWARPDNVIWIMPPGDTGCGLWRMMIGGGSRPDDASWILQKVFTKPEKRSPPEPVPVFPPPTPKEALAALDTDLRQIPRYDLVKEALFSSENSDSEIVDAIALRSRRRGLEGDLLVTLYKERPVALNDLIRKIQFRYYPGSSITGADLIVAQMQADRTFADAMADKMFEALPLFWLVSERKNAGNITMVRYIELMQKNDPSFFCARIKRVLGEDGIVALAEKVHRTKYIDFIPYLTHDALDHCGQEGKAFFEAMHARAATDPHYLKNFEHHFRKRPEISQRLQKMREIRERR
ncbi:MAG TPA: hypothetical protein PL193_01900 [Xanthobacteraceae bacterium]|nr:hypothetical protein [Xanthobacteraceae bacterium]